MKKLFIIIPSNRCQKLSPETVAVIQKTKTPTIFVKQNLPPYYQNHPQIKEIISHQTGVSKARNLGIKSALKQGADIIAFTDDDCIITEKWIKSIHQSFLDPQINAVFGQTLPWHPQQHPSDFCPCTFSKKKSDPIFTPVSTWNHIGMSNNFAITPKIIHRVALFSPHLGPGTKIPGSEDSDYIIRIIKNNFPIYYEKEMLIYHNRWISQNELQKLYQKYTFSFAYIYFYHSIHTDPRYLKVLIHGFFKEISYYFTYFKKIIHPRSFLKLIFEHSLIIYSFLKGCVFSLFYP